MKSVDSLPSTTFSGRRFTRRQLWFVQQSVERFSNLSRKELAQTLCEHLRWKTPNGKNKTESCLKMLQALEDQGVIKLPDKRERATPTRPAAVFDTAPSDPAVECALESVRPIRLELVRSPEERRDWKAYLQAHHYLGYRQPVGAHLGYFIVSESRQQRLGCLLFSASAAWALAPRDQWIGWDRAHREKLLSLLLSNDRFLIFPWVRIPNLASHALSVATQQVADDWLDLYGYRPVLIETFVDPTMFSGSCYRAANWHLVGQTQGRGRLEPEHQSRKTKKDIYLYPLSPDWQSCLTTTSSVAELGKRRSNERRVSRNRSIDDGFLSLWQEVVHLLHEVADEYDQRWRLRKRVIDSLMLVLLIFRLVSSRNTQSYGTTIDDLWHSCEKLQLPLPQKNAIAASSFCAARKKLDEAIFVEANRRILETYASQGPPYTWRTHRLFAVDGSKLNLPRELRAAGYPLPTDIAHYPQGLLSCLYQLESQLPFDFDLVSHGNERLCALRHLEILEKDDVVVYDRGYFSYPLLYRHHQSGIHAVFRLQESMPTVIQDFFASSLTDTDVLLYPSPPHQRDIRRQLPDVEIVPVKMRLLKYEIAGATYYLGTTLVDAHQRYPLDDFVELYHARWGIEELYKISKRIFGVEDFHARSERGVKQELFAHFVLITMNRLFANRADRELNPPPTSPPSHADAPSDSSSTTQRQTNFKNCIHVIQRNLEELVLLQHRIQAVVQRTYRAIVSRHQRARPGRAFPRRSLRPNTKWHSRTENNKTAKPAASPAPA